MIALQRSQSLILEDIVVGGRWLLHWAGAGVDDVESGCEGNVIVSSREISTITLTNATCRPVVAG
jgi:hypothetical protein